MGRDAIIQRLGAKGVDAEDAKAYAKSFVESKSTTRRKLATLKEEHLCELAVAVGHRGVIMGDFKEWLGETTTPAAGHATHITHISHTYHTHITKIVSGIELRARTNPHTP